jgi:site-specific recombinase XerD
MSGTRRKPGRLGPFVEGYRIWLLEVGYTAQTVRAMLKDLGRLGCWMDAEGVEVGALTAIAIESFLADWRAAGGRRVPTVRALRSMLTHLREVGVMVGEQPPTLSAVEVLVGEYRDWLIADRGLAAMTVLRYETLARRFLTARVSVTDELGVADLDGAVVSRFLLGECGRVCLGSAKGKVAELRSLLRFLHLRGFTPRSLVESVPGVAGWRETSVPPTMPQSDIERLLASCDRATLDGARDRGMLMLCGG